MNKTCVACIFIFFSLILVLSGCVPTDAPPKVPDDETANRVRIYDIPDNVSRYDGVEVYVEDKPLPVYSVQVNTSQSWSGNNFQRRANGVCMFELDGTVELTVKPKTTIDYSSVVRPLSAKVTPIADIENNTLKMTIKSAGEYVLEINADPHDAVHFFVSEYDEQGVNAYTGYDNVMVFEAGLHTAQNDGRISVANNNLIRIPSNTLVYLADGAVVRGRFQADNAQNIAIAGRGVIDGSMFVRDATRNIVTVPIELNYCKNVLLKDFFLLDPAGWSISLYFNDGADVDNIKIITSRSNGDGISVQSSKNVTVDGCFVRTWDDSLVVKNYPRWDNRNVYGQTENIVFKNCTVWTDLAQSMELGYETVGSKFQDVTFENITVLHAMHLAVISIHNANNAEIKNVKFKDITIEDGKNSAANVGLIDFRVLYRANWSDQHTAPTALGNITDVLVENVKVLSAKKFSAYIGGCMDTRSGFESEHFVTNVTIKNVELNAARPALQDCSITFTNSKYVRNFQFEQDGKTTVTGSQFLFTKSEQELALYNGDCKLDIVK